MSTYKEIESAYKQNMFAREGKKESLVDLYQSLEDKSITADGEKNLHHLAARFFDYQAIEYLIDERVKPRADDSGNTP
ncbi:MAG: hypothetical protein LBQ60_13100, partial [Bacteroidales bacterium]|nr:hypothetical protein [Bacteroidales bacterium]